MLHTLWHWALCLAGRDPCEDVLGGLELVNRLPWGDAAGCSSAPAPARCIIHIADYPGHMLFELPEDTRDGCDGLTPDEMIATADYFHGGDPRGRTYHTLLQQLRYDQQVCATQSLMPQ
jgi:hypothetical protein